MNDRFFIDMPVPADKFEAVCAVLAGSAVLAVAGAGNVSRSVQAEDNAQRDTAESLGAASSTASSEPIGNGSTATSNASPSDVEIDAHGHPWSADLHASTKGKTKDGLWRMKVGVVRPAPLPGFPVDNAATGAGTGTSSETLAPSATSQIATDSVSGQPATSGVEEDDEFAAFREAAKTSDATDQAAVASVPARQYSDADLGALCNQAAVKLGDPGPVKAIIAKYMPEGTVAHSRNVPAERRADFVKEIETAAGITFAG